MIHTERYTNVSFFCFQDSELLYYLIRETKYVAEHTYHITADNITYIASFKTEKQNVLSLFMTLLWSSVGTMQRAGEDSDIPDLPDVDKGMH